MKYDLIMLSVPFSYALSSIFNFAPRTNHCILFGLGSYFALFICQACSVSNGPHPSVNNVVLVLVYRPLAEFSFGTFSVFISRIFNEPRVYDYTAIGATSYFAIINWPIMFGLEFLASAQILKAKFYLHPISLMKFSWLREFCPMIAICASKHFVKFYQNWLKGF